MKITALKVHVLQCQFAAPFGAVPVAHRSLFAQGSVLEVDRAVLEAFST